MCSSTGSSSLRASSGSESASNSIDPLRSANRTVTSLRSPSNAFLEVRIFSARCFGVYASGAPKRCDEAEIDGTVDPAGRAHSEQNFALGESWAPQLVHTRAKGAAHSSQNFAPERFSCWHFKHFTGYLNLALASVSDQILINLGPTTSFSALPASPAPGARAHASVNRICFS